MNDDELMAILSVARQTNQELEITGMLLYRDGFFIQALEGEETQVKALYDKIRQDPRHRNVVTVDIHPITERAFVGWHMGFNKITDDAIAGLDDAYTDFLNNPDTAYFTDKPDRAKILLHSFRNRIYF
jgi:hypothetical protein